MGSVHLSPTVYVLDTSYVSDKIDGNLFAPNRDGSMNPSNLAFAGPSIAIDVLIRKQIPVPKAIILSELSRHLDLLLYSYLNDEGNPSPYSERIAKLLFLCAPTSLEIAQLGDGFLRIARLQKIEEIAEVIGRAYLYWAEAEEQAGVRTDYAIAHGTVNAAESYTAQKYAGEHFAPIRNLKLLVDDLIAPHVLDFVIQGSLSDMQLTAYSDIDCWSVVRASSLFNPDSLRQLREGFRSAKKMIRGYDPLQHHGIFVATEPGMAAYRESRMPLLLMDFATSLCGAPIINATTIVDTVECCHTLRNMAHTLANQQGLPDNAYELKLMTSRVMLLPTFFHQALAGYIYKPQSFNAVKEHFSPEAWKSVEASSELRELWTNEITPAALSQLDAEILHHVRLLGQEALVHLESANVQDIMWNQLGKGVRSLLPFCNDYPAWYSSSEFEQVTVEESEKLAAVKGVRGVYEFGSGKHPCCGISDLDLLGVIEPSAASISSAVNDVYANLAVRSEIARYIKYHEEALATQEMLPILHGYWTPAPRLILGVDDFAALTPLNDEEQKLRATVLLFREGLNQLFKLVAIASGNILPARLILLRSHSVIHDIRIVRELFGIEKDEYVSFEKEIKALRNGWFDQSEAQRLPKLKYCLEQSIAVLHTILEESVEQMVYGGRIHPEGVSSILPFSGTANGVPIGFSQSPDISVTPFLQGKSSAIQLSAALFPIVYCIGLIAQTPLLDQAARDSMQPQFRQAFLETSAARTTADKWLRAAEAEFNRQ